MSRSNCDPSVTANRSAMARYRTMRRPDRRRLLSRQAAGVLRPPGARHNSGPSRIDPPPAPVRPMRLSGARVPQAPVVQIAGLAEELARPSESKAQRSRGPMDLGQLVSSSPIHSVQPMGRLVEPRPLLAVPNQPTRAVVLVARPKRSRNRRANDQASLARRTNPLAPKSTEARFDRLEP